MAEPLVGIIANPASGRDIRRFVAYGSVFDNNEKIAIVRRMLLGLEAVGITRIAYMPEYDFGIVPRALDGLQRGGAPFQPRVEALPIDVSGTSADSTRAAEMLAEMGAGCILTLGGDGTNRAVAKGCRTTPLVAVSTGTNNVFPVFLEGTVAGMAAGLVAARRAGAHSLTRAPLLEVAVDGVPTEVALIDVVASSMPYVGSRALWDLSLVREAVISRVTPATIGLSALGGALLASAPAGKVGAGMSIVLGPGGQEILVALAPGLVRWVGVARYQWLVTGQAVRFRPGAGTVALDGEREIGLAATSVVEVRLSADGPFVVNVPAAMEEAARSGFLYR